MIGPHVLLPFLLCSLPSVQGPGSNQGKIDCLPRGIEVENLGLASPSPIFLPDAPFGRNFVVFTVSEADQGNTSSNGDSDVLDDVVHVVDTRTGQVIPLQAGVAQNVFAFRDWVVYAVSELAEGATDLDGDGDAADDVLHRFDVRSGVVANTGLPVRFTAYSSAVDERLLDGDRLLFYVSEDLADLNGDGDTADAVLHVMDVPTGVVTNLGLATADTGFGAIAHVEVDHGLALCVVDEASQGGTDLNGDGDALDLVVHLIDLETSTVTNLGLASSLYLVLGDRLGAFAVPEASQGGIDLNGDGDAVDQVLYFYDRASTQLRNSQRDLYYTVSTDGRFAAWTVSESAQGQDLDGDGMLNRSILHTYDADADLITNLQLYSANYVVKNDRLVTSAIDLEDLDADGDTTDIVTYVLELAGSSGAIIEDTYASMSSVRRHSMVLTPSESVFGCDFNGDGDLLDVVPALYDFRSGTTRSLGVSSNGGQIWRDAFERMIIVAVDEGGQGGQDLDGDGDATDFVPHVFSRGRLHNTHLASGPNFAIQGNQALFLVREGPNGGMDLNGDGDALDAVFHVLRRCR